MKQIQLTYFMVFKFLWSYIWRLWVCTLPVCFVAVLVMRFFIGGLTPVAGQKPELPHGPGLVFAWLGMMLAFLFIHTLAMKWALRAEWSDFRLVAIVPPEKTAMVAVSPVNGEV